MHLRQPPQPLTRREALRRVGGGFGMLGLAGALQNFSGATVSSLPAMSERAPHFAPKAKHVIFLFLNGGLSESGSSIPKPALAKYHGQPLPGGNPKTERRTGNLMQSPFAFKRYGESGLEVSELFPHVGTCADDLCVIRSAYTDIPNHEPSLLMMNNGHIQPGRPSFGAWTVYGLGTQNQNLPGYIVLSENSPMWSGRRCGAPHFCRPYFRDRSFRLRKATPKNSSRMCGTPTAIRYSSVRNWIWSANWIACNIRPRGPSRPATGGHHLVHGGGFPYADGRSGGLRYFQGIRRHAGSVRRGRVCARLPVGAAAGSARRAGSAGLLLEGQPLGPSFRYRATPQTGLEMRSGHGRPAQGSEVARSARRDPGPSWTEFGRTPVVETGGGFGGARLQNGRDHNPFGFSVWMAGGGVKGGTTFGATDDFGFHAVEDPVHVHDIHATMLHAMGLNHERLTYRFSGRDFRLTDVAGNVIHKVLA